MKTAREWMQSWEGYPNTDLIRNIQRDALEGAAKRCEELLAECDYGDGTIPMHVIADMIRALKPEPPA